MWIESARGGQTAALRAFEAVLWSVTDLRIGDDPGPRAFGALRNSSLWRLTINLKFAKLWRRITSQITLKWAKVQTSSLDYQYTNNTIILKYCLLRNTIILFATQYKNKNIAFHRSSGVTGSLALLWGFCQWQIEHQIRKCCAQGLILRNMAGRERDAGCLPAQNFLRGPNTMTESKQRYFSWALPVKEHNDKICLKFKGNGPLAPLTTPMVTRKEWKRKNSTFLMFNLPDKKLATMQGSQALQNSDEKQYCQYRMLRLVVIN